MRIWTLAASLLLGSWGVFARAEAELDRPAPVGLSTIPGDPFREVPESQWIELTGGHADSTAACSDPVLSCDQIVESCDHIGCESGFWDRRSLTNGFFGAQQALAEEGITYSASLTQFYQGVASGGDNQVFKYGGKLDQFVLLNSEQLGLWNGTVVSLHAETRFGEDVNLDAVGLAPVNANMLFPSQQQLTSITGLNITQYLSEEWLVAAGTFNQLDLFTQLYPQIGRGIDGFMNISSLIPLSLSRPFNLSMLGASVTKLHGAQVQGSLGVYNTANATTNSTFDQLFVNGAVVLGYYRIFTDFADLPGSHALLGVYSSGSYTSVDPLSWAFIPNVGLVAGQETGTWNLTYLYEKKLWIDSQNSQRNLGVLATLGISDGNPNPFRWAGNVAFQGNGLIESRPLDTTGVAYFYSGLSSDFRKLAAPLISLDDVQGVELYYNIAVTTWFHLTTDLQVIEPANTAQDTALVLGLRGKIDL